MVEISTRLFAAFAPKLSDIRGRRRQVVRNGELREDGECPASRPVGSTRQLCLQRRLLENFTLLQPFIDRHYEAGLRPTQHRFWQLGMRRVRKPRLSRGPLGVDDNGREGLQKLF